MKSHFNDFTNLSIFYRPILYEMMTKFIKAYEHFIKIKL